MKVVISIIFILSQYYSIAGWQNVGNCSRIKAYNCEIVNFVLDQDNKYLFTIDSRNTLKKFEIESGEIVWSKQIHPDSIIDYTTYFTFLSSDANTYLNLSQSNIKNPQYIFIHDIENDIIVDSLSFKLDFYSSTFCYTSFDSFFCDYISQTKKLIYYINSEKKCVGDFTQTSNSGHLSIETENIYNGVSKLLINDNYDKFYCQVYESNWTHTRGSASSDYSLINGIFMTNDDKFIKISDYSSSWYESPPNPPRETESGIEMRFTSSFFDIPDSNIYLLLDSSIYRYNLFSLSLQKMYDLFNYSDSNSVRIYKTNDKIWYQIIKDDSISVYFLSNNELCSSFKVDSINKIKLYQNSKDGKYLFLTDSVGSIYKIRYSTIFGTSHYSDRESIKIDMYFNSITNKLTIQQLNDISKIEIYSSIGFKVLELDWKPQLDVSSLPSGVYFVRVGDKVSKFVKI